MEIFNRSDQKPGRIDRDSVPNRGTPSHEPRVGRQPAMSTSHEGCLPPNGSHFTPDVEGCIFNRLRLKVSCGVMGSAAKAT